MLSYKVANVQCCQLSIPSTVQSKALRYDKDEGGLIIMASD